MRKAFTASLSNTPVIPPVAPAGKTLTAPLDRVKLLLQTRGGLQAGALKEASRGGGLVGALTAIGREEGFFGYWKGNVPQVRLALLQPAGVCKGVVPLPGNT